MFVLFNSLIVLACFSNKSDEASEKNSGQQYYQAQSVITLESSGVQFDESYLVRRSLDSAGSQIVEEFFSTIDSTLTTTTYDVDTDSKTFVLSFSDESYTGEGTFEGQGLGWSAWESNAQHSDGTFVISHDSMDEEGIHTGKVGYGMDGDAEWTLDEELSPLDPEEWAELFDALPTE